MGRRKIKREGGMDERQDEDRVGRKGVAEKNHFEGVRERGWTERGSNNLHQMLIFFVLLYTPCAELLGRWYFPKMSPESG